MGKALGYARMADAAIAASLPASALRIHPPAKFAGHCRWVFVVPLSCYNVWCPLFHSCVVSPFPLLFKTIDRVELIADLEPSQSFANRFRSVRIHPR